MLTWLWPCSNASLLTTRCPALAAAGFMAAFADSAGVVTAAALERLPGAVSLVRRNVSVVERIGSVIQAIGEWRFDGMNTK
ncbi:hypothetical protein BP1258A_3194 [Burkholderia pseudomallei 1258a]|uniref:Secreted protein n=3 Tax=Burkholderia pseudomallei TaxID=28450 RepID=A0A0H3HRV4_BURP2|nr:hypothetical protein BP1026B_II0403 [Burkholderia pseudomallei 1026b]EIF60723.1 hypothetical protein BP1258A_3194 [Burkholderia pseudomallei 1258a]EIF61573.1 hypothetical protein BP1258B_3573 [Burkholderia pseudomallei 1258b]EIF62397.1 hypothetical protein BP1026A_2089 [Burkholderia pseudomallei 1026a]EIF69922.1 hypothetical protein BP354E_5522 [Burkholderia pseudomallei 354e]EIF72127.1 hypothetical protein BP354A_6144 [Burkholderia pseudomallei 354a]